MVSGPTDMHLNTGAPYPLSNFTSAVPFLNGNRVAIRADYGFGIYDISSPAVPSVVGWANHFSTDPNWGFYGGCGDGQSFSTDWISASGDGARVFSSTSSKYECRASNLVMASDGTGFFRISGDTGYSRAKFLAVQKAGTRYILYGFSGVYSQVWAADVSNPPGFVVDPWNVSPSKGNIPFEYTTFPAASSTRAMKYVDPGFLLLADYDALYIADVSNPGPPPAPGAPNPPYPASPPSITAGKTVRTVTLADFGRAAYPASQLMTVGAALNASGKLYIVGEFKNASLQPDGFALVEYDPASGSKTLLGSFLPPTGFSGPGSMSGGNVSLVPEQSGVGVYFWAASQTGGTGDKPRYRLYAGTGDAWKLGSSPLEVLTVDTGASPNFAGVSQSEFVWRPSTTDVVTVIATAFSAYTLNLSCQSGPAPASSTLKVEMEPCPATGPCEVKTGSSPVVVGQKLKISPTILPLASVLPIIDWKLDFDYHASETPGTTWGSLKNPDYGTIPAWTAGTTFTLIGPCDKNVGSADPVAGTNCWTSVTGNGSFGGPDFGSANPAWGTTSSGLQIGFEGRNTYAGSGTNGPAVVPITWKVPTVQLASYLVLKGNSLQDATERPTNDPIGNKAGYKWYVPNTPNTSPTVGNLVSSCNGLASCVFSPTGPPGVYKVWLTTPPYPGGYQSCDLGQACAANFQPLSVTLAEVVPNFTIGGSPNYPTVVLLSQGSLSVVDTSTKGPGITITGYKYCTAAVGSSCDPATRFNFTPGATAISLPAVGDYWFFFGVSYSGGTNNFEYFTPNKETNARAWKVSVTSTPPSIRWRSGVTLSSPYPYVTLGQYAELVLKDQAGTELTAPVNWSILSGNASPTTGSGATFTFMANSPIQGNVVVHVDSPGVLDLTLGVYDPNPPPSSISVSVVASPSSPSPGTPVTFTAYASGGTAPYYYAWNFGDGQTASAAPYNSVSHTYASTGYYTVTSTVTDSTGASGSGATSVSVGGGGGGGTPDNIQPLSGTTRCTVSCTSLWLGTVGTPIQVAAYQGSTQLSGPFNWGISLGSATPSSGSGTTFTFTPSAPGPLRVAIGSVYLEIQISGSVTPDFRLTYQDGTDAVAGAGPSYLAPIGPTQVTFRAVNAANGQPLTGSPTWDFGDGTSGATGVTVTKVWANQGTYPVRMTVPGLAPVTYAVHVVAGIPTAAYSYVYSVNGQPGGPVNPNRVSPGAGILFSSTGPAGAEYYWNFGDGTVCNAGTPLSDPCRLPVTSHAFAVPGNYMVVLTVKLGGNAFQTQAPTTFAVAEAPRWIVSGLAYTEGILPDSYYVSDVVIQNPSATEWAAYSVALLDGSEPVWKALELFPPLSSRRIPNVLKTVFGKGAGPAYAMAVRGDTVPANADPVIWGFTYNRSVDPAKGTYGVAIPAIPAAQAVDKDSAAISRVYSGLRDIPADPPDPLAAYANVGFVNTGSIPATVNVKFFSTTETGPVQLGYTVTVTVDKYQTKQVNKPLRQALLSAGQPYESVRWQNYYMTFEVVEPGARVIPYATEKDVASTDSILMTGQQGALGSIRVPSVVRVTNATGDAFRSRVVISNPTDQYRDVRVKFSYQRCPTPDTCEARDSQELTLTLVPKGTILSDDFVRDWFVSRGVAFNETDNYIQSYVDVTPVGANQEALIVRGETYNALSSGNFGTQVPGLVPPVHGATPGSARTRLMIPYVVPKSGGSGYRTNVAFVALGEAAAQARVILRQPYPGAGLPSAVDAFVTVNDKFLQYSLEKLFPELANFPVNPGGYYWLEVQVTQGTLAAYAIVNDNITSDGSLVMAQPLP